jgi:hypothetical protein
MIPELLLALVMGLAAIGLMLLIVLLTAASEHGRQQQGASR